MDKTMAHCLKDRGTRARYTIESFKKHARVQCIVIDDTVVADCGGHGFLSRDSAEKYWKWQMEKADKSARKRPPDRGTIGDIENYDESFFGAWKEA